MEGRVKARTGLMTTRWRSPVKKAFAHVFAFLVVHRARKCAVEGICRTHGACSEERIGSETEPDVRNMEATCILVAREASERDAVEQLAAGLRASFPHASFEVIEARTGEGASSTALSKPLLRRLLLPAACVLMSSELGSAVYPRGDRRLVVLTKDATPCRSDWSQRLLPAFSPGPVRVAVFCESEDAAQLAKDCPDMDVIPAGAATTRKELLETLAVSDHAVLAGGPEMLRTALECLSSNVRLLVPRKANWARKLLELSQRHGLGVIPYDGPLRKLDLRTLDKNAKTREDSEANRRFLDAHFSAPDREAREVKERLDRRALTRSALVEYCSARGLRGLQGTPGAVHERFGRVVPSRCSALGLRNIIR